ncbi:MAG: amidohydrolase family protein [Draconibacterium sp.]|nr:amidohydrolase family protein [Draconibacterium sp.]
MRKIAATYIFPCNRPPVKNGILICGPNGTVVNIIDNKKELKEESGLEFYSGILVPGFVNTHCHLELSHLKGKIEENAGIGGFIGKINTLRNEETESIEKAIQFADRKMWAAGIAAVGDISNSILTLDTKIKSKIFYHTFVESFGFHPSRAERAFEFAKFIQNEFQENNLNASIVPHSPYSVSKLLFNRIKENAFAEKSILTIHNQESKGEAQFFIDGTGPIANHLQHNLGIDISLWQASGKSSLSSVLKYLSAENQLLLVHSTFTKKADLDDLKKCRSLKNTFFVLCPNSNLYIENQLPPVSLFRNEKLNICLGTDSLASNHNLSVLSEMITLQQNLPEIEMEELLIWATLNGAKALGIEPGFGSFQSGKKPGVNLITGIDFKNMKLTEQSTVKRLV